MTNRNTILSLYADVVSISEKMLAATQAEDWELLKKLEAACAAHINHIRATDKSAPLSGDELKLKIRYIEKILATDKQIRHLIEPWMARLSDLIHNSGTRQKLHSAYGMNDGH